MNKFGNRSMHVLPYGFVSSTQTEDLACFLWSIDQNSKAALRILFKPKFHLLRHVTIRQARRVVRAAPCLFQHGGWRRSCSARA